jgi:hypothetical protein
LEKDLCLVGKEVQQSEYKMSSFFALWIYFENQKGNEISPFDLVGNALELMESSKQHDFQWGRHSEYLFLGEGHQNYLLDLV